MASVTVTLSKLMISSRSFFTAPRSKCLWLLLACALACHGCGKTVKSYVEEADILVAQNRMDEAIILYQKAIKDYPKNPVLYINQAVLFREDGKPDLALKNYQVAHELNPDSPLPFIGMGRILTIQNHFGEAKDVLEKAVSLAPDNATALFMLGHVYFELKDGAMAITFLNRALLAQYKTTDVYYYRGRTYEEIYHNTAMAMAEYENYLKIGGSKADEVRLRLTQLRAATQSSSVATP
jgi:tetratricopeptide (TPR) repeat protein